MRLIAIDPSIRALGWCIMTAHKPSKKVIIQYVDSGCLRLMSKIEWRDRVDYMTQSVMKICKQKKVDALVFEEPILFGMFGGDGRGDAANNTGSVLKLMGVAYSIRGAFKYWKPDGIVHAAPVNTWKGNVPKHITRSRMERRYTLELPDHNESDAIGIADWYLRKSGLYS